MPGPKIGGDSIDMHGDMIVTGSDREDDIMQLFSISQQVRVFTFDYSPKNIKKVNDGYVLATRFSPDGKFIITGGAGWNEVKIFANDSDSTALFSPVVESYRLPTPVFSIAVNPTRNEFAVGQENGNVHMVNY